MPRRRGAIGAGAAALGLALLGVGAPARADWARVEEIPATELFSLWANGDTLAAGADTAVYVSTDAGLSWRRSSKPAAGVAAIEALWIRAGRIYAGTFGQGVHVSDDWGASWLPFNEGLTGGAFDSQLDVVDLLVRGDSLLAATAGAGVYVRDLSSPETWRHFGDVFEPNQASNVNSLALGGSRVLAMAGANGMVFVRDPSDADWTISDLDNVGIHAGLQPMTAAWTGTGWVVGTSPGVFRSVAGEEPWTLSSPGLGPLQWTAFTTQAGHLYAAFDTPLFAAVERSDDDGANWQDPELFSDVFIQSLAISRDHLYAARGDGLWRRLVGTASVEKTARSGSLEFSVAGPQPFRDRTRLRFALPTGGTASIELFDVSGRAAGERLERQWTAGPHELPVDARDLSPGVYLARLTANGRRAEVRLVHVR